MYNLQQTYIQDTAVDDDDPDKYYEIEHIASKRYIGGRPFYHVFWAKPYEGTSSWDEEGNITKAAIDAYYEQVRSRSKRKTKNN